jgi:regulator of replication initiation timing
MAATGEFGDLLRDAHRAVDELDRLRAENERLREALSKVEYLGSQAQSNAAAHMGMIARAALSGSDERG